MTLAYKTRILIGFFVAILLLCSIGISICSNFIEVNNQMARMERAYDSVAIHVADAEKHVFEQSRRAVESSTAITTIAAGLGFLTCLVILLATALSNLQLQKALNEQSTRDPLTQLFNRRYLEETMTRELARAQRHTKKLSVLIMDIDHFKKVNDTHGHDAGDAVLIAFAKLLSQKIRKEDIACRLGGEEFVLVLPDADVTLAQKRAEEICEATHKMAVTFQKQTINVTVSIGVCMYPDHGQASEELLHHADLALYKAKHEGRDRVAVYNPDIG